MIVAGLKSRATGVRLLASSTRASVAETLRFKRLNPLDLSISVPRTAPDRADSVIAIECAGEPEADPHRLLQPQIGVQVLRVFDAQLHGKSLRFGPGKTRDSHVTGWTKQTDYITWALRLNQPATFEATVIYDSDDSSTGNKFELIVAGQHLMGVVEAGSIKRATLGRFLGKPGSFDLRISPVELKGTELMKPRVIELKPVATVNAAR